MNDIENTLRKRLSPEGRAALAEVERVVGTGEQPEGLMRRIDNLSDEDRPIFVRLLSHKGVAAEAEVEATRRDIEMLERFQTSIDRAATLEGVDPETLTGAKAEAILARHGEAL